MAKERERLGLIAAEEGRKEARANMENEARLTHAPYILLWMDMGAFSIFRKLSSLVFFASSARGRERERERAERE